MPPTNKHLVNTAVSVYLYFHGRQLQRLPSYSAVSLSFTEDKKTVHTGNECLTDSAESTQASVYMCGASQWFVFFPLQVVQSIFLCSWFCLLHVDDLGIHCGVENGRTHECSRSHLAASPQLSTFSSLCRLSRHPCTNVSSFHFVGIINSQLPSPSLCFSFLLSLAFLQQCIPTVGMMENTATLKNLATTIMSTLTSHNNTRITYGGGAESSFGCRLADWTGLDCQHCTELQLLKCEICLHMVWVFS